MNTWVHTRRKAEQAWKRELHWKYFLDAPGCFCSSSLHLPDRLYCPSPVPSPVHNSPRLQLLVQQLTYTVVPILGWVLFVKIGHRHSKDWTGWLQMGHLCLIPIHPSLATAAPRVLPYQFDISQAQSSWRWLRYFLTVSCTAKCAKTNIYLDHLQQLLFDSTLIWTRMSNMAKLCAGLRQGPEKILWGSLVGLIFPSLLCCFFHMP